MEYKFAAAEHKGGRRPGSGHTWLSRALAVAIVLSPSAGICAPHNSIQTSLQATLTVVSDSGTLSVARVAGDTATGPSKTVAVHPWCSPSCIVFIDRDPGVTGSPGDRRDSMKSTPEGLLVTPETGSARLALPAGSDRSTATLVVYF
jgi:hypothetical protein